MVKMPSRTATPQTGRHAQSKYAVGDVFVDAQFKTTTIVVGAAYVSTLAERRGSLEISAVYYPCIQNTGWSTGDAYVVVQELEAYLDKVHRIAASDSRISMNV